MKKNIIIEWNIVLIWVWWTGISALAGLFFELWLKKIVWIDNKKSEITEKLKKLWINIFIWEKKYKIKKNDFVIYSDATINTYEVKLAKDFFNKWIKKNFVMSYFQFIWEISKYFSTISIAWTNWKSSTTSLAIYTAWKTLSNFWLWIVWALVPDFWNKNYLYNKNIKSDLYNIFFSIFTSKEYLDFNLVKKYYFFIESCEYMKHFLHLDVDYAIITNITFDHWDYFKTKEEYLSAFSFFKKNIKKKLIDKIWNRKINFKFLFWEHRQRNANLIIDLFLELWIKEKTIISNMKNFKWLWRRLEYLWNNKKWAKIYTDYWHVAESLLVWYKALKEKFPQKKILLVFQPHQLRRILQWWKDFKKNIQNYDKVIIYDIYLARENISELLDEFNEIWIKWIKNKEEIWNFFANENNWQYFSNFELLKKNISDINNERIIIIYSAWNLDYLIRNEIKNFVY